MLEASAKPANRARGSPKAKPRRYIRIFCALAALLAGAGLVAPWLYQAAHLKSEANSLSLHRLLQLPPGAVSQIPIGRLNLLCAKDLWLTTCPDVGACESTLRAWAERVKSETARHQYRYDRNPAEFENSPGFFRMLMLTVVLAEDYHVRYDRERLAGPAETRMDDGFFSDPATVCLHGLLGPERKGTCSSMPVLYVAIGRHLGYPLKLVTTKGHLFVRWEGTAERFNIEATSHGLSRFADDYYRRWPFAITPDEEKAEGYLKSLTPSEELAVFLSIRGMCLREQGRLPEAIDAFADAVRLAPVCGGYRTMLATLQNHAKAGNTSESARQ